MLARLTNRCQMRCAHCMVDASPDGCHMTPDTFAATLAFTKVARSPFLFLSGGEPSEHPCLVALLRQARLARVPVLLLSNGEFLVEQPALARDVLSLVEGVQVTNDPRFYPRRVEKFQHPKVKYEDAIRQMSPFGRARANSLPCNRRSPLCFNLRSFTRSFRDIWTALQAQRERGSFCTPSVTTSRATSWPGRPRPARSSAPSGTTSTP